MNDSDNLPFEPANNPIQAHTELCSCIEILGFDEMTDKGEINKIQVFYERIGQEIYNTRKKNYSWGFAVIEPHFFNFSERLILSSNLYKEKTLADLNSVVFKLFAEFNNIILVTALDMQIPIRGIIRMGETYKGAVRSRKPALLTGEDPLILSDLLKVFSISEIFPNGFSEGMIPAVDIPYHFGPGMSKYIADLNKLESVGIFMPPNPKIKNIADVTILSGMMSEIEIDGKKYTVCNWKTWMNEHSNCSMETILAAAESKVSAASSAHGKKWQSFLSYSARL
jgi:hypothetical protein